MTTLMLRDVPPPPPMQTSACFDYLACATGAEDPDLDALEDRYGRDGSCWAGDVAAREACDAECEGALQASRMSAPVPELPVDCLADVDYRTEVEDVLNFECAESCHEPGGTFDLLDLSGNVRNELILVQAEQAAMPYVLAGDHEQSYLFHKLVGSQGAAGGSGGRMPRSAAPLPQEQIDAITAWIRLGARP